MLESNCPLQIGSTDGERYAHPIETAAAIDALSPEEHKKLILIARYFYGLRKLDQAWAEPEDLLLEAITRTLAGERRWRKGAVSIVKHLDRVMESVSGHWVAQGAAYRQTLENARTLAAAPAAAPPVAEEQLQAREQLQALAALFAGDEDALTVLWSRAEGKTAAAIKAQLGIGDRAYQTISRRIRRRLVKFAHQAEADHGA